MVIQVQTETPIEVSVIKAPQMDAKKYVIVKNHVRELTFKNVDVMNEENLQKDTKKVKKSSKKRKASDAHTSGTESDQNVSKNATDISESDLEELRSVYKKCKSVINKIETKYGHLLNLSDEANSTRKNKAKESYVEECNCGYNRKFVFNDDGQQIEKEAMLDCHVCPKKWERRNSNTYNAYLDGNVSVQYEVSVKRLPDDIHSLSNILQNTDISVTYRNKVIRKLRTIKQELLNEVRFNKPSLKEKIKTNPADIFEFKGTNLFSMPGYPDGK